MVTDNIRIPFKKLNVVIDVTHVILNEDLPNLLSMKDMLVRSLDISIQESLVSLGAMRHLHISEN